MTSKKKKILVAPLDWGIGHAARCIPIIDNFLQQGNEVVLAGNGRSIAWLENRFPQLVCLKDIPDYDFHFSAESSISLQLLKQWSRLKKIIQAENEWLQEKIESQQLDLVYSDNRYGLHSSKIKSILLTHQLRVHAPWFVAPFANRAIRRLIANFDECQVPDFAEAATSLSGKLSHPALTNCTYIGPISRFSERPNSSSEKGHLLGVVSGPEPFRTEFETALTELFQRSHQKAFILAANPQLQESSVRDNVTILSHVNDSEFAQLVSDATCIIARSGYSTLLDLHALNASAVLVPTPGQAEQEYLAQFLSSQHKHQFISQQKMESLSAEELAVLIRSSAR